MNQQSRPRAAQRRPTPVPSAAQVLSYLAKGLHVDKLIPNLSEADLKRFRSAGKLDAEISMDRYSQILLSVYQAIESAVPEGLRESLRPKLLAFVGTAFDVSKGVTSQRASLEQIYWVLTTRFFVPWTAYLTVETFRTIEGSGKLVTSDDLWFLPSLDEETGKERSPLGGFRDRYWQPWERGRLVEKLDSIQKRTNWDRKLEAWIHGDVIPRDASSIFKAFDRSCDPENVWPLLRVALLLDRSWKQAKRKFGSDRRQALRALFTRCYEFLYLCNLDPQCQSISGYLNSVSCKRKVGYNPALDLFCPLFARDSVELVGKINAELEVPVGARQWPTPRCMDAPMPEMPPTREFQFEDLEYSDTPAYYGALYPDRSDNVINAFLAWAPLGEDSAMRMEMAMYLHQISPRNSIRQEKDGHRFFEAAIQGAEDSRRWPIQCLYCLWLTKDERLKDTKSVQIAENQIAALGQELRKRNLRGMLEYLWARLEIRRPEPKPTKALRHYKNALRLGNEESGPRWESVILEGMDLAERKGEMQLSKRFKKTGLMNGILPRSSTRDTRAAGRVGSR